MNNIRPLFSVFLLVASILCHTGLMAQELNCKVQINTEQISGTDKAVYENLKKEVQELLNSQQWSRFPLKNQERIDCSMLFIMKSRQGNTHTCDLQIQSSRPVYGTTYSTSLLNMREELTFEFMENQNLTYNETSIDHNLTATLAFWAYVILGLDFDSFSRLGGTPFFQKAQEITSLSQGSLGENWKPQEDKNHWGWINALTDENQPAMRLLSYQYHRLGLDKMYDRAEEGRNQITAALSGLKPAKQTKPRSPLLSNFMDAKADELIHIYSGASSQEKQSVFAILTEVYPASVNRLQGIKTKK
ncbi:MAG: DUF4835 family protein [Bacteroidales bacterium]|nr:DUF4835 family protein [Bacteroidales bacterium]